jgi:hypothetical protein
MTKFDAITDGDDSLEHAKNDGTKAADHHGIEAGKHGDDHPASKWAEIAVASCKSSVGAAGDGACSVPGGHLPDLSLSQKESSGDDGKAAAGRKSASSSGDEALARSSVGTEHSLAAFSALAEAPAKDADKIKPAETSTSQPAMVSAPEVAARVETRPTPAQPDNLSQQERSPSASDMGLVDSKKQASVNQVVRDFSGMVDIQSRRVDVAGLADKGPRESRTSPADSFNAVAEKNVASSENGTATISGGNNSSNTALASVEVAAKASAKPLTAVDIAGQTPTPGQRLGGFSAVVDKSGTVIERSTATGNLAVASDKVSPVSAVVKATEIVQTELSVTPANNVISAAVARSDAGAVVGSISGNSASTLGAGDASRFVRQPSQQSADGAVPILRMPVEPVSSGPVNLSVSAGSGEGRSDAARPTDRISPVVATDNSVKAPAASQLLSSFAAVTDKVVPAADRPIVTANPGVSTDKSAPVSALVKPTEIVQTELSVVPTAKPISAALTRSDAGVVLGNPSVNGASSLGAGDGSRFVRQPSQQSVDGLVPVVKAAEPVVNGVPGAVASVGSVESRNSSVRAIDANSPVAAVDNTVKVQTGSQLLGSFASVVDKVVPVGDRPTATGNLGVATDKNSPVGAVVRPTEIAQTELSVTPNAKPGAAPVRTDAGAVVGNTSGNGATSLGAADTSRYARQPVASSPDGVVPVVKMAQVESQSPVAAQGTSVSDKPVKASGVESASQSGFGAMVDKVVPVGDRPTATGNLGVAIDKNSPVGAVVRPTEIAQTELSVTPNAKPGAAPVRTDAGAVVGNTSGNGATSLGAADTSRYARQPVASSPDGVVPVVKMAQVESQSPVAAQGTSVSDKPVKASGVESASQSGFGAMVDKVVPVGDRPTATGNLGVAIDKNSPVGAVVRPTEIAQTELSVTPNAKPGAAPVRTDAGAVVGNTSGNGATSLGAADTSRYARQPVASSPDGVVPVVKMAQVESQSPVVSGTSVSDKPVKASGVESASQSGFGAMVDKVVPVGDRPTATGNLGVVIDKNSPVSAVVKPTEIISANNSATSTAAQSTAGKFDAGVVAGNTPIGLAAKLGSVLDSDLTNPAIKTGAANVANMTNRADVDSKSAGVAPAVVPVRADANVKVPVAPSGVDGLNVSSGAKPALASDTTGGVVSTKPVGPTPATVIPANVPAGRAAEAGAASVPAKSDEHAVEIAAVAAASVVAGKKGMAGEGTNKTETVVGKGSFVPTKVEPINGAVVGKLDAAGKVELAGKNDVGATPATSSLITGKAPFTSVKGHVSEDKSEPASLSGKKLDSNETLTGKAEPVKGSVPGIKTTDTGASGNSVKVKGEADKADDEVEQADFVEETSSALGIFNPALGGPGSLLGVTGSLAGALNDPSQSGGTAANSDPDKDPAASEPPALNTSATLVPQAGAGDVGAASNRIDYALPDLEIVSDGCGEGQRQDSAAMTESLAEASSKDDSESVRLNDCDSLLVADARTRLDAAEGARQRRPSGITAAEMQQALEEERRRRAQQRTGADKETAKTGKGGRKPQAPAKDDLEKRRKHRIGETDTLESISEQILGHCGLAELIYIINRGFFRESRGSERGVLCLEFVAGTVIFLPTDLEIQEYLGRVRKDSALRFEYQRTSSSVSLRQIVVQNSTRPMARAKAPTTFKVVAKGNSQAFAARNRVVRIDDVDRMLVSDPTQQLAAFEEISRVVTSAEDDERYFARIEVMNGEHWSTVVEYTIEADGGVMLVHSKSGNVRTIPVDLPVEMLKAMAVTDLSKNRLAYSRKFMQGRKIFA